MLLLKNRQCLFKCVGFGSSAFIWLFRWCFLYFISFLFLLRFTLSSASVLVMILFFSKFNFIEYSVFFSVDLILLFNQKKNYSFGVRIKQSKVNKLFGAHA